MKPFFAIGIRFTLALAAASTISCITGSKGGSVEPKDTNIGTLTGTLHEMTVSTTANDTLHLTIAAGVEVSDSSVKVVRVDANGKIIGELGILYDDGKLYHGDDILGDKVYSGIFTVTENTIGSTKLRVDASVKSGSSSASSNVVSISVISDFTPLEAKKLYSVQDSLAVKLNTLVAGNPTNLPVAMNQLNTWLKSNPEVDSVIQGEGSFDILYKSGVWGGLIISQEDANGATLTKGGMVTAAASRRLDNQVPISQQTRGTPPPASFVSEEFSVLSKTSATHADLPDDIIGNRRVIVYSPFEAYFKSQEGKSVANIFQSDTSFTVTYLENTAANVASFANMTDYGYVMIDTHGSRGREFGTGEVADTTSILYKTIYKSMLKVRKLAIWKNVTITSVGAVKTKSNVYAIRWPFIDALPGKFPNSVIMNSSCESSMNPDLKDAFIEKGAHSYYGYSKVVNTPFSKKNSDSVANRLAIVGKTTQQSFSGGSDPTAPNAVFELYGTGGLHYPDSLINGDFEFGNLNGWTKVGDGRVISQLVTEDPTGGKSMGIISTGLGFTTSTGIIHQTFKLTAGKKTLTVKWNFLSEEFLEYIGSSYQDYFQVIITKSDGSQSVLLNKTIDGLAAENGASYDKGPPVVAIPGSLISVSPAISFDQGGVFETGWKTSTFDISAYAGQKITLTLRALDAGDSIYDTVILLDDITIQ